MGTIEKEISFFRENWTPEAAADLYTLCNDEQMREYFQAVETNAYLLVGVYKNSDRIGTVLAKIMLQNCDKKFVALEVAGHGLSVPKIAYPLLMAFAKRYECDKFVVGVSRPAMIKYCEENKFEPIYVEYEKDVKEFFNE